MQARRPTSYLPVLVCTSLRIKSEPHHQPLLKLLFHAGWTVRQGMSRNVTVLYTFNRLLPWLLLCTLHIPTSVVCPPLCRIDGNQSDGRSMHNLHWPGQSVDTQSPVLRWQKRPSVPTIWVAFVANFSDVSVCTTFRAAAHYTIAYPRLKTTM